MPPVAGIAVMHELFDDIELETGAMTPWAGTNDARPPVTIRHEVGDARPQGMAAVLQVPPWCTFHLDDRREPAAAFHAVFGEVDRLLRCEEPGSRYVVRYASRPRAPVVALQSELAAFSFALAARGIGLIAHSCAFVLPSGDGVLCPGVSGTGKTTLARLLREQVGSDVDVLTDDRAIVTLDDRLTIWGSPWPGAAGVAGNSSAPLRAVVFIRHSGGQAIRDVSPREAFRRIVNTLSMPLWEPARCARALEIVDAIVSRAVLVEVAYAPAPGAAEWLVHELSDHWLGGHAAH